MIQLMFEPWPEKRKKNLILLPMPLPTKGRKKKLQTQLLPSLTPPLPQYQSLCINILHLNQLQLQTLKRKREKDQK